MLAFSNDYYGFIFRVTQSVELFCTYFNPSTLEVSYQYNSRSFICFSKFRFSEQRKTPQCKTGTCPNKEKLYVKFWGGILRNLAPKLDIEPE
ncbi:hypothetical protein F170042I7_36540 [Blautia caecimuris]